ncbi:caspase family protein [Calothrix rhizosoleniae]|uniref:caspase family protein n=1 Tax=Calothrix rhizosoleniae TaxID=888997 RepID=UPI000B49FACF|nr:caspase family protein [Calothrix rhizosoleniae]
MFNTFTHGYALLIGVGESAYPKWSLPVTVKDIQAIRDILIDPNFCAYPNNQQHIRLLNNSSATRRDILDGLTWLNNQAYADPQATVIVYYSGHGWLDQATQLYYLIPHDVKPFDIPNSALSASDFTNGLRQINSQRLLVIIDCCHAEGIATAKKTQTAIKLPSNFIPTTIPKSFLEDLKQGQGRAVFSSCRGKQSSWIRPDDLMSIYTYHLVEALKGAGNQPDDQVVRLSNLMNHLSKSVPENAHTLCQAEQIPFFETATEDFTVALLRGNKGVLKEEGNTETTQNDETSQQLTEGNGDTNLTINGDGNRTNIGGRKIEIKQARDIKINL